MPAPNTTHDHEIIQTVEELYADPENRDRAEGGVAPQTVASHLGIAHATATDRLRDLTKQGDLEQCDGLEPGTMRPRKSYAPSESPDGGGGRTGGS
ncbi:hypothetical protein G9C85_02735 [Halorubellus sp. JP-L1]|uniref:hypothetical protein n=1 Tax=Halorubellus sp. JP-L1 TaxID=2715753 RepID=UPI00140B729C|nr:hypothetical protein [Halorubellus sp. JP-L1]NHN40554.1 hypothetical protein [Halorubellus sp. JP-L1]